MILPDLRIELIANIYDRDKLSSTDKVIINQGIVGRNDWSARVILITQACQALLRKMSWERQRP